MENEDVSDELMSELETVPEVTDKELCDMGLEVDFGSGEDLCVDTLIYS